NTTSTGGGVARRIAAKRCPRSAQPFPPSASGSHPSRRVFGPPHEGGLFPHGRPAGGRASIHEATILDRRKEELSRDNPGCGSPASREGRACRSSAASSGIRRPSACSARKPLRG